MGGRRARRVRGRRRVRRACARARSLLGFVGGRQMVGRGLVGTDELVDDVREGFFRGGAVVSGAQLAWCVASGMMVAWWRAFWKV